MQSLDERIAFDRQGPVSQGFFRNFERPSVETGTGLAS
jgi:hypothetical protein